MKKFFYFGKSFLRILLGVILLIGTLSNTYQVKALTPESSNIQATPNRVVMQINELGKIFTITLTNNSGHDINLVLTEGLITQNPDGTTTLVAQTVTTNFLEISPAQLSINNSESTSIKVRTKIINTAGLNGQFPALVIKQSESGTNQAIADATYIPFIMQSTSGKLSMQTDLNINVDRFSFTPDLQITGSVSNNGDQFFTPSGSVTILKNGEQINELKITDQVGGILFPNNNKTFTVNWSNPSQNLEAVGEYTVKTQFTNDLSDKATVSIIKFIYIPVQLIYILAGGLGAILIIVTIIIVIRKITKKH